MPFLLLFFPVFWDESMNPFCLIQYVIISLSLYYSCLSLPTTGHIMTAIAKKNIFTKIGKRHTREAFPYLLLLRYLKIERTTRPTEIKDLIAIKQIFQPEMPLLSSRGDPILFDILELQTRANLNFYVSHLKDIPMYSSCKHASGSQVPKYCTSVLYRRESSEG